MRWLGAAFVLLGLGLLVVPGALVAQPPPEYYSWLQYAVAVPVAVVPLAVTVCGPVW